MDVTLYKSFSVENKIEKNITQVAKYTAVQLVNPTDDFDVEIQMTVPTNTLRWDNVNYFEWDGAFYFLESVDKQNNAVSVIKGRMDLLMTYKTAIKQLNVRLVRSTNLGSPRAEDDLRQYSVDSNKATVTFPKKFADTEATGNYIFVTSQRGYQ